MTKKRSPAAETKGLVRNSNYLNYTSSFANTQHISALLADRIDSLVPSLFPDKYYCRRGNQIRVGNNQSLSIELVTDGLIFYSHETCNGGNVFALIQDALAFKDFKSSLAWAKSFLGLADGRPLPKPMPRRKEAPTKDKNHKIRDALQLIGSSFPITNTYAEQYIRIRGITIKLPDCLRFHPSIYSVSSKQYHPSLIAPVHDVKGNITAVHYVSLDPFTCHKIQDEGINAKISKGTIKGGAVRLPPDDCEVTVCEGIEDGLSLLQLNPSLCVWCGLGGNIRNIEFPPEVTKVIIAADNDIAGKANASKLYQRLKHEGKDVSITYPPEGFKDFNAYLMGGE